MTASGPPRVLGTSVGDVEVKDVGEGPAIVVMHGRGFGSGVDGYAWLRAELPNFRIISIARPGYGQTPLETARTFEEQGRLIDAVLLALDVDRAIALGVSNGGPAAIWAAALFPERVAGLVLWCAVATPVVPRHELSEVEAAMADDVLKVAYDQEMLFVAAAAELEEFNEHAALAIMSQTEVDRVKAEPLVIESLRDYLRSRLSAPPGLEGMRNDAIQNQLDGQKQPPNLAVPALIMHGDQDSTVPLAHAKFNAERGEDVELVILEGGSHGFFHGFRIETVVALREFANKVL